MKFIEIKGAKAHNLKNISLKIPRDKLTVITGLSGSGKSSLAFDTIYAEGQRRYVESLSTYARQFLSVMYKADLESIDFVTISDASLTSFVSPEAKIEQIALTLTISLNGPFSPFNSCIISLAL